MKYDKIKHPNHPKHKLKFQSTEIPFKCDGCKEVGIGSCYTCDACNFDLHVQCAIPSPSINHPFYTKCSFQFHSRPPAGDNPRPCSACKKDVIGFVYHCTACKSNLHPCCAMLPMVLDAGKVKLYLYKKVSSSCHRCGRKGEGWSYRSKCKKYNLHVACVKEMEVWHELLRHGKSSRKMEMTRIPTLKNMLQTHHHHKSILGKVKKCCEIAGIALKLVIAAVLGDPTTLIVGLTASLMSRQ